MSSQRCAVLRAWLFREAIAGSILTLVVVIMCFGFPKCSLALLANSKGVSAIGRFRILFPFTFDWGLGREVIHRPGYPKAHHSRSNSIVLLRFKIQGSANPQKTGKNDPEK